ncbi:uncharacterized protein FIBRA_04364 [Fibroporia radiculosa]|uniref:Uncharacterized protein n=1 Tax=Fibroporia radiculosa TaxID=599839 RepID=J4H2X4_9APHY|nr:uncharacterized protein FIBRA_04364 [Fibroporia radiculosa]CCM02279.1 predicted protein [Fibroporia radiculosa]
MLACLLPTIGRELKALAVTKLLLGARVALPGAALCLCWRIRHYALGSTVERGRSVLSFDYLMCLLLPIVYMAFHIIVQDYRFNLTEDVGCTPSVYASVPSLILVWLPPFLLSLATFMITTMIISHQLTTTRVFSGGSHGLITMAVLRPLIVSFMIVLFITISTGFFIYASVTTVPGFSPWTSWASVHYNLSRANIIPFADRAEIVSIELAWWVIPASSLVFVSTSILGFVSSSREDALSGYRELFSRVCASIHFYDHRHLLPSQSANVQPHMTLRSVETLAAAQLKSGWDDDLDAKPWKKRRPSPISIVIPKSVTTSPPASTASCDADASFAQSTLTYLQSPTGRDALGLASPPPSSWKAAKPPSPLLETPVSSNSPLQPPSTIPDSLPASPPHSILSAPWPRPPSAIPVSPVAPIAVHPPSPKPTYPRSRPPSIASVSASFASSTVSTSAYAPDPALVLHDSPTLPHFPPFADSGIPTMRVPGQSLTLAVPERAHKVRRKDRLLTRNLSLSMRGREKTREDVGAIYMTVVKETV